ncbi:unnamed protein product [Nippostrongylus brasiliensis]|uniref:Uncharacterized protein n=1 Tax=Nippostrongylus brasiliensis TaxID=27835 RepID=A0A0N4XEW4_NIPBR|nr:unnamed protein product [Nippostrongylus brasiliensis]
MPTDPRLVLQQTSTLTILEHIIASSVLTVNPSICSPAFAIPFVDPTVRHVTGAAVRSALLVRRLNATAWRCTAGSEVDCQVSGQSTQ